MIKLWNPQTWQLTEPIELWVDRMSTLRDLANALSEHYNIPVDNLICTKINSPWNFHRIQLPFIEWVKLSNPDVSSSYLSSSPFYLSTDGILFIIRDSQHEIRDMSQEEKDLYRCEEFENCMFSGAVAGGGFKKVAAAKEQGVKITVKAKEIKQ